MYPSVEHSYNGIHVKEQIDHLTNIYQINREIYFINSLQSKTNYIKSMFAINKLIRTSDFDIIHIHFGLSALFLLLNPFIKIPVVLTIHGSDINSPKAFGFLQAITKMAAKKATKIIILNPKMAMLLTKFREKLVQIPCGINIAQFTLDRNNNKEHFVIGFPGDPKREVKNYPLFEQIVNELIKKGVNVQIIEFHNLTRIQVAENLSKLDCLVMTSHSEGSPQIIKEAMACYVPIVSANVGDVKLALADVSNCYIIDKPKVEPYVIAILKICRLNPDERRTNGKEKLKLLALDQDSVCTKIITLYENIIKTKESEKTA